MDKPRAQVRRVPLAGKKAASRVAVIDDGDWPEVSKHTWYVWEYRGKGPYARTNIEGRIVWMHKLITGWPMTDHINHDGLDNRRENLRPATGQENQRNSQGQPGKSSRFKGVSYFKETGRWEASIGLAPGQKTYLGRYATEEAAARAYDAAALEHFGEFAHINFPCAPGASDAPAA